MDSSAIFSKIDLGDTNYSYANTRVRAMESKILTSDIYMKLLNMDVSQISRFLGEVEYKEEIDSLSKHFRGVELIERSLNKNLANTYNKLLKMAGKEAANYAFAVFMRWDVHNIISILRGKFAKVSDKEIEKTLIPIGEIPFSFIQSLTKFLSYQDVIRRLKKLEQFSFLDETKEMADIESELYKNYFTKVLEKFRKDKKSLFLNFVKMEIDIINLKNIMRMRRYGFTLDEEEKNVIDGGLYFKANKLSFLLRSSNQDFLTSIKKTPYGHIIEKHFSEPTLFNVEESLEIFLMQYAKKQLKGEHLSIIPILHYIYLKKIEVDNIRKIARGIASNLEKEVIQDSLVI